MTKFKYLMMITLIGNMSLFAEIEVPKIVVSGSASIYKPADFLSLTIGAVSDGQTVKEALADNNQKMQKIIEAVKSAGIEEKEIQTNSFTINPKYSQPPKNPPPDWQTTIVGYEVANSVTVKTANLFLAGPLIDAVSKEGANQINDINFTLFNNTQAQAEAIAAAVEKAKTYAEAAANQAGISLGTILELSTGQANVVPTYKARAFYATSSAESVSTPIASGNIEVHADVTVTYAIGQGAVK